MNNATVVMDKLNIGQMGMNHFLRFTFAMLLLTGFTACQDGESERTEKASATHPNIIYIYADDLGYGEVGAYGQTKIKTPNLDKLAAEGAIFTQHYSGSPVCAPSRSALMEGKHTGHNIVRGNYSPGGWSEELGQYPLPEGTYTIGRMLQNVGYKTAAIGKWGLGGIGSTGHPNDQGFDHFFGFLDQKHAHNYYPTHLWRNRDYVLLDNAYFNPHDTLDPEDDPLDPASYQRFAGKDYAPDLMADEALQFITDHQSQPFFLYFPVTIPHVSLQVPEDSLAEYEGAFPETPYTGLEENTWLTYTPHRAPRAAYAAMITRMDGYVGRIMEKLRELGLDENTIIIFSSDNGPTFNGGSDSTFFESAAGLRGLKGSVYEGGIRVPMIARWPGKIPESRIANAVSAQWDMMATFADITGAEAASDSNGVTLLPVMTGETDLAERDYLYWELSGQQAVRMGDWKAVRIANARKPDADIELYNLGEDEAESRNVADAHPDIVARMEEIMRSRKPSDFERWNRFVLTGNNPQQ